MSEGTVYIETPPCMYCGKISRLEVDAVGLRMWQAGAHIQRAFPHYSPNQRELILTGTHPECWDKLVPPPDDDDDEYEDDELADDDR